MNVIQFRLKFVVGAVVSDSSIRMIFYCPNFSKVFALESLSMHTANDLFRWKNLFDTVEGVT
jgi:hypothetical protein